MTVADFESRIIEGRRLARAVVSSATNERLLQLLLDADTAVTYKTALALLARRDDVGVGLILQADVVADDDTSQWLGDAFASFCAESQGKDDEFLRSSLQSFVATSEDLRLAARDLPDWLDL